MLKLTTMMLLSCILMIGLQNPAEAATITSEKAIKQILNDLFTYKSDYLAGRSNELENFYDLKHVLSQQAYNMEVNRTIYLHTWAKKRNMKIVNCQSKIRVTRVKIKENVAIVSLGHSQKISYSYNNHPSTAQWFGLGTWHAITLKKMDGRWIVWKEWYLDPLEENPRLIPSGVPIPAPNREVPQEGKNYKRKSAVAYADKYAGLAWGAGNNGRYNRKYKSYNNKGGDCTNFASQAIGDPKEGGGLQMHGSWRYYYPNGGSRSWIQTDALKDFILYSGYGRVIANDFYPGLIKQTASHPYGRIGKLMEGDLIAHVLKNDVDHFSIVTGFDDHGYPLVNSHTADRFRAPFDLGWDKTTKYILIHIRD